MYSFDTTGLLAIFPPALRKSPDYWLMAQVIAPELAALFQAAEMAAILPRIDEQPEAVLDALAKELDIAWWKPDASLEEKRLGVKTALVGHRRLGTKQAVQDAVDTFLGGGTVYEWFEYDGEPYHYRISGVDSEAYYTGYDTFMRVVGNVTRFSAVLDEDGFEPLYLATEEDDLLLSENNDYLTT